MEAQKIIRDGEVDTDQINAIDMLISNDLKDHPDEQAQAIKELEDEFAKIEAENPEIKNMLENAFEYMMLKGKLAEMNTKENRDAKMDSRVKRRRAKDKVAKKTRRKNRRKK